MRLLYVFFSIIKLWASFRVSRLEEGTRMNRKKEDNLITKAEQTSTLRVVVGTHAMDLFFDDFSTQVPFLNCFGRIV